MPISVDLASEALVIHRDNFERDQAVVDPAEAPLQA